MVSKNKRKPRIASIEPQEKEAEPGHVLLRRGLGVTNVHGIPQASVSGRHDWRHEVRE